MIPTINTTGSLSQPSSTKSVTPVTPVTASTPTQDTLSRFIPGQKYQALIETKLPNGNSRVFIADQLLHMQLPRHFKPGTQITLTFVENEPKLKFLLQNNPALNTGKPDSTISMTGRFLGILSQNTAAPKTLPNLTTTPVLPSAPLNSIETPVLLQQAISQSGLFYEAHQAQWIKGKRSMAQLQQEPQGKLTTHPSNLAGLADSPVMPAHTQSLPLVQQQMNILETGILMWHGEIWPEQNMEWEISEHEPEEKNIDNTLKQWKTKLRLTLPNLGEITANIVMGTQGLQVKLDATESDTAQILKKNSTPLTQHMATVGLNVRALEIQHDKNQ